MRATTALGCRPWSRDHQAWSQTNTRVSPPIPGGVGGTGAVRPVYRNVADKGVTPFDVFVFVRSARVVERSRQPRRSPRVLPCEIGPIAIKIGDNTKPTTLGLFIADIIVKPCGTLDASVIKQSLLALVTEERAGELPDLVKMSLLDLIRLADTEEARLADGLPILGSRRATELSKAWQETLTIITLLDDEIGRGL
jgi:hypothetical protein